MGLNNMFDFTKKEDNVILMNKLMLNKTLSMFEYANLPDTLPPKVIEKHLQTKGFVFITEVDGVLYPLTGNLGGELDVYGDFTKIIVTNTALNLNKEYNLKTDGVLISNDDLKLGLIPIFDKFNTMLAENDINMLLWGYNSRQQKLISASDDKTKASAENYLKKLVKGELSVIGDKPFLESLTIHSSSSNGNTKVNEFLELHQYFKSNLLNEIGLSSNFNMKKERLISSELDIGEDSLFPLVYTMMKNRIMGIAELNEKYSLDVDVNFGSVWALKNKKLVDGVLDYEDTEQERLVGSGDKLTNEHIEQGEKEVEIFERDGGLGIGSVPVIGSDELEVEELETDIEQVEDLESDSELEDEELEIDEEKEDE